jgi:hypothetical protein
MSFGWIILLTSVSLGTGANAGGAVGGPNATSSLPACGAKAGRALSTQSISLPAVNEEQEVEPGSSLLSTAQQTVTETGLILTSSATVTGKYAGADFVITIPATDLRLAPRKGDLTMIPAASFRYQREKSERHGFMKPDIGVYEDPNDPTLLKVRVIFGLVARDFPMPDPKLDRERCLSLGTGGFRHEIIYSGAAKGVISLLYREYVDDLARPAFSQVLTYDLADGNEIGLKGARIRVIKASNTGLRYVVLRPVS